MKISDKIIKGIIAIYFIAAVFIGQVFYAQQDSSFIDKVQINNNCTQYYLHYDKNGNAPEGFDIDRLKGSIKAGDQVVVRFYPNSIFKIDPAQTTLNKPGQELKCFLIFPKEDKKKTEKTKPDTFSIQSGYADFYFATDQRGRFLLKISKDSSKMKIGDTLYQKTSKDAYNKLVQNPDKESSKEDKILTQQLKRFEGFKDWRVRKFENQFIDKGIYIIELFLYSPNYAILLSRIRTLHVDNVFQNTHLTYKTDIAKTDEITMEKIEGNGYYQGLIKQNQIAPGILSLNVVYDYTKESWYYRQAPTASVNRKLFYNDKTIAVEKFTELPASIRIRAGMGVFNNLAEVRIITNFVLVMNPKDYFADSTPFLQRFNPTLGLQIGATGDKDLIVLMGLSFKLINEGDIVLGFRFNGDGNKWQIGRHFYFGITLDPGLFGQLKNSQ